MWSYRIELQLISRVAMLPVCSFFFITPRACARGKVIGWSVCLSVVVATKIARSEYVGITMVSMYDQVIITGA